MTESDDGMKDGAIVRSVLRGEIEAYSLLAERHGPRLLALAFHLSGDYETAADLTQETLLAAYNSLDRIREPRAFGGWVASILRNKFRNLRRKNPAPVLSLDQLMDAGFEPSADKGDSSPSKEDLKQVMECVTALPNKYRETLLLRYSDDLSYKEMAESLDLPMTTVTTRLTRARKLLVKQAKKIGLI